MITMPDNEERSIQEIGVPCSLQNWPQALRDISIPFVSAPMDQNIMVCLGCLNGESADLFDPWFAKLPEDMKSIWERHEALKTFFDKLHSECDRISPFFVRLGTRSPKDSYEGYKRRYRCDVFEDALELFAASSDRMSEDLWYALNYGQQAHFVIRPWVDIEYGSEARCFVREGRCVGVSEYDYRQKDPTKHARSQGLLDLYVTYPDLAEQAAKAAELPDVIVDVCRYATPAGPRTAVVEINPFCDMTDPCLFSWRNLDDFGPGVLRIL